MAWNWRALLLGDGDRNARPLCRELECLYHDGDGCTFPWIETPSWGEMLDRERCRHFLIAERDQFATRINALH